MSSKRKRAPAKKPGGKRGKRKEESDIDSDLSERSDAENATQPDEVLIAGHGDALDDPTPLPQELLKTLIKPAGQLLLFGSVNWDTIGKRDVKAGQKVRPNLYVPHKFTDQKQSQLQSTTQVKTAQQPVSNQELEINALAIKLMNLAQQFQAAANAKQQQQQQAQQQQQQQQQQQAQQQQKASSNAAIINLLNSIPGLQNVQMQLPGFSQPISLSLNVSSTGNLQTHRGSLIVSPSVTTATATATATVNAQPGASGSSIVGSPTVVLANSSSPNLGYTMEELPETYVAGFHDEAAVRQMAYTKLGNTGLRVSKLSFGTGVFSYFYGEKHVEIWKEALHAAIRSGINFVDTAPWYGHGQSEEALGYCLQGIPRKAYYLATKVGRYEKDVHKQFDFSAEKTRASIEQSLRRLKLDYVDLLQIHDVEFAPTIDQILNETLPAVREIVESGKARHLGITGYPLDTLKTILDASPVKIETVLTYTRLTLIDRTLDDYLPQFQKLNVGVINAAVNSMGLLSSFGPPDWHPAPERIRAVCDEARAYCASRNVELGKLAVWYALQQPGPHTTLVGMNDPAIVHQNLSVLRDGLGDEESAVLEHVRAKIFSKLERNCNWENVELIRYRKITQTK